MSADRTEGLSARWEPLQVRVDSCGRRVALDGNGKQLQPRKQDPRDRPIEFSMTPQDRDRAAMAAIHLEANRRRLNRKETAQAVADELARRG